MGDIEGLFYHRVLFYFNPSFSLLLHNPEGSRGWYKKENKVLDSEVNDEFGRGNQF